MSRIAGSIFMLSTAVISLMYCSIQTQKCGLTADRENNVAIFGWRIGASSQERKSEAGEKQAKYEKEELEVKFMTITVYLS